jgi:hypothetical protein
LKTSVDESAENGASPDEAGPRERLPLGQMLVEAGFLTRPQVDEALAEAADTGERLGEVVVRHGWATEEDVAMLLAEQWGLGYVASSGIWFEGDALMRLSREDAKRVEALPTRIQDGHVVVAVAEPTEERLADLRRMIGEDTVIVVVPKTALYTGLQSELLVDAAPQATVVPLLTPPVADEEEELTMTMHEVESEMAHESGPTAAPAVADTAASLAAQVRGMADSIAALAEYEQRVAQLEADVTARREATRELRELLARAVQLLDETT